MYATPLISELNLSRTMRRGLAIAGHLAAWPALYAGAVMVCFAQLAGLWNVNERFAAATISVVLTAMGAYLLDRVKLRSSFMDPADRAAQPARYEFLSRHEHGCRWLAIVCLLVGAAIGSIISRWVFVATTLSVFGVVSYAFGPRGRWPRPKDLLPVKNIYVAAGLTCFSAMAAIAAQSKVDSPTAWWMIVRAHVLAIAIAAAYVFARAVVACAICDIDDGPSDRRFGTQTAVTRWGGQFVLKMAVTIQIVLAVVLLMMHASPLWARVDWAAVSVSAMAAMLLLRPSNWRDLVDVRFPIEAALCTIALLFHG